MELPVEDAVSEIVLESEMNREGDCRREGMGDSRRNSEVLDDDVALPEDDGVSVTEEDFDASEDEGIPLTEEDVDALKEGDGDALAEEDGDALIES